MIIAYQKSKSGRRKRVYLKNPEVIAKWKQLAKHDGIWSPEIFKEVAV